MGRITAVRKNSPAAQKDLNPNHFDYYIEKLELADSSGNSIHYPEKIRDPLRLPDELQRWASSHAGEKTVTLILTQAEIDAPASQSTPGNHPAQKKITLHLPWQEGWDQGQEEPLSLNDPLTIGGLGIAYRVNTTVEAVEPNSPAAAKGIKKDDKIVAVRFYAPGKKQTDEGKPQKEWTELKPDQWAYVFNKFQFIDIPRLDLRFERDGGKEEITLEAAPDETWPRDDRGLLLLLARQQQKADSFGQALAMGINETWSFTSQIFGSLKAIATRRVSATGIMGPIGIAQTAFGLAGEDFDQFLIFLGIIGINLAVINFLPIPVLDGGHMAFLLYEWVRGKPAPEAVRIAATYVGLALIASLMILVIYLDVKRVL
jgi:regulator of sigma E protease